MKNSKSLHSSAMCIAIMAELQRGPATVTELHEKIKGSNQASVRRWCAGLDRVGLVHISEWRNTNKGLCAPVYKLGIGEPAPCPYKFERGSIGTRLPGLAAFAAMWRELLTGPSSIVDLCSVSGLADCTARRLLKSMHAEGLAKVVAWADRPNGTGARTALWGIGRGEHMPRPQARPSNVNSRAYYWRKKSAANSVFALGKAAA